MSEIVINNTIDEIKLRLNSIIEVKSEDSFKTHLKDIFQFKNEGVINGGVLNSDFSVWIHEQGRSGVTGFFYPVILGHLKSESNVTLIRLRTRMNVVGFILFLLITAGILYSVITGIVIQEDNSLRYIIPRILIATVLLGLWIFLPIFTCFRTAKIVRNYLVEKLVVS